MLLKIRFKLLVALNFLHFNHTTLQTVSFEIFSVLQTMHRVLEKAKMIIKRRSTYDKICYAIF
jgi:hypothetical protein